jgi:hypothetical protein
VGDGIIRVAFITFIFEIPAASWHPKMRFIICVIIVYQDSWVSGSDLRLLNRRFGRQIGKQNSIMNTWCFNCDNRDRRSVLRQLDLPFDCSKSVFIHPLLVALQKCVPCIQQDYISVCKAKEDQQLASCCSTAESPLTTIILVAEVVHAIRSVSIQLSLGSVWIDIFVLLQLQESMM